MKKTIALFLAIASLSASIPVCAAAETLTVTTDACADAVSVWPEGVNAFLWGIGGLVLSVAAVGAAFITAPEVPADRLIGKSAGYAAQYSECFRSSARLYQGVSAAAGCTLQAGIIVFSILSLASAPI